MDMPTYITEEKAVLLEIGELRQSEKWSNIYLKFRTEKGEELWFQYSEHIDKPRSLKQIPDFLNSRTCQVGMTMSVTYKIVQSPNKSTKLRIDHLANYCLKK